MRRGKCAIRYSEGLTKDRLFICQGLGITRTWSIECSTTLL